MSAIWVHIHLAIDILSSFFLLNFLSWSFQFQKASCLVLNDEPRSARVVEAGPKILNGWYHVLLIDFLTVVESVCGGTQNTKYIQALLKVILCGCWWIFLRPWRVQVVTLKDDYNFRILGIFWCVDNLLCWALKMNQLTRYWMSLAKMDMFCLDSEHEHKNHVINEPT